MSEIIVLAVIGLIVIGPKELPELARTIGRFLNELKRTTDGLGDEFKEHLRVERLNNIMSSKEESESQTPAIPQDYPAEEMDSVIHHEAHHENYPEGREPEQMVFPETGQDEGHHANHHPDVEAPLESLSKVKTHED